MSPLAPGAREFLAAFPRSRKAELHLHLEGAVFPSTLVRLSGSRTPKIFPDVASVRARLRDSDFQKFLLLYRDVCGLLRAPSDYALLARDLVRRLRRDRIGYAEVYVSPALVARLGFSWSEVVEALEPVFRRHEDSGHGRVRVLLDSVRQWGAEAAEKVLEAHRSRPWSRVVGFGIGGDETSVATADFVPVYARARKMALGTVIHAGEWRGADSVDEALRLLRPSRIAHGVRAIEDPAVVARLARTGTPLDICIASNEATGAAGHQAGLGPRAELAGTVSAAGGARAAALPGHPALELLRRGVRVTLSTDDPGLFATTLAGEYRRFARLGATGAELHRVAANGRAARFG